MNQRGGKREGSGRVGHVEREYRPYYLTQKEHLEVKRLIKGFKAAQGKLIRKLSLHLKKKQYEVSAISIEILNSDLNRLINESITIIDNDKRLFLEQGKIGAYNSNKREKRAFRHYYLSDAEYIIISRFVNNFLTIEKNKVKMLARNMKCNQASVANIVSEHTVIVIAEAIDKFLVELDLLSDDVYIKALKSLEQPC